MQKVDLKAKSKELKVKKETERVSSSPSVESAPTRELMELPAVYRAERAKKAAAKETADIEDLVRPHDSGKGFGQNDSRKMHRTQEGFRGKDGEPPGFQGRGERSSDGGRVGRLGGRGAEDQVSDRRGRGRGRGRRDREEEDDYYPQKRKETFQLFDFFQRPEQGSETKVQQRKDDNVLDDYYYDPVADQYIPRVESYSYPQGQPRYGSDSHPMDENLRAGRRQEGSRSDGAASREGKEYSGRRGDNEQRGEYRDEWRREYRGRGRKEYGESNREGSGGRVGRSEGDWDSRDSYSGGRHEYEGRGRKEYGGRKSGERVGMSEYRDWGSRDSGGRHEHEGRGRGRSDYGRGRSGSGHSGERGSSSYDGWRDRGHDRGRDRSDYSGERDKGNYDEGWNRSDNGGRRDYSRGRGISDYDRGRGRSDYGAERAKNSYGAGGRGKGGYDGGRGRSGYGEEVYGRGQYSGHDGGGKAGVKKEVSTKQHIQDTLSHDWSHLPQSGGVPFRATKIE